MVIWQFFYVYFLYALNLIWKQLGKTPRPEKHGDLFVNQIVDSLYAQSFLTASKFPETKNAIEISRSIYAASTQVREEHEHARQFFDPGIKLLGIKLCHKLRRK